MLADTIRDARAIVENGWCKKVFSDSNGNHCVLGGVKYVLNGLPTGDSWGEYFQVRRFLSAIAQQQGYVNVMDFNDHLSTTHQDVLNFLDKALAELGAL